MPDTLSLRPIDQRILDCYEEIPKKERKLAGVLLERRLEFSSYTLSELADLAGVSKATAARLFRRLGYRSFEESRKLARQTMQWGGPLEIINSDPAAQQYTELSKHMHNDLQNLINTFEGLEPGVVDKAVELLSRGRRVWIMGMRAGFGLAHYARFILNMLKDDVRLLPVEGLTMAEEMAHFGPEDVILIVAMRRRTELLARVHSEARRLGAFTILLTDLSAVEMVEESECVIRCHARGIHSFDSYSAVVSVLNLLCTRLGSIDPDSVKERLEKIETHHAALQELSLY